MSFVQSIRGAVGLPRKVREEEFKKWRRESTDPVVRSGACYVPMPGKEKLRFYSDKQNLHHLGRYEWAKAVLQNSGINTQRVLDCACGVGYGAAKLAEVAEHVDGVDQYQRAIARAESKYARPNIQWHGIDATELMTTFAAESFDAIVSFQTIECIEDDQKFLDDFKSLLKPGGVLLIDTPLRSRTTTNPENKHHCRYYSVEDWIDILVDRFETVDAFDSVPEVKILRNCGIPSGGQIAYCQKA